MSFPKNVLFENGQRVVVLDYLGDVIGDGCVYADKSHESNEHFTWVTFVRGIETITQQHPTSRLRRR